MAVCSDIPRTGLAWSQICVRAVTPSDSPQRKPGSAREGTDLAVVSSAVWTCRFSSVALWTVGGSLSPAEGLSCAMHAAEPQPWSLPTRCRSTPAPNSGGDGQNVSRRCLVSPGVDGTVAPG